MKRMVHFEIAKKPPPLTEKERKRILNMRDLDRPNNVDDRYHYSSLCYKRNGKWVQP